MAAAISAKLSAGRTALTRIAHRAPMRLLPMRPSSAEDAGAAWCALGSLGGGLLGGDKIDVDVAVGEAASLCLFTQSSTKVYRTRGPPSEQRLHARVARDALLVLAPDPIVPFEDAAYAQAQCFELEHGSSAVLIDWFSAGRAANGERWAFRSLSSRSELRVLSSQAFNARAEAAEATERERIGTLSLPPPPAAGSTADVVEAIALDGCRHARGPDPFGFGFGRAPLDACASVLVTGPRAERVARAFACAAHALAAKHARARAAPPVAKCTHAAADEERVLAALAGLSGHVHVGIGIVECGRADALAPAQQALVVRLVGAHNEDVCRVLHGCLGSLREQLGGVPYSDRLHSTSTAPAHSDADAPQGPSRASRAAGATSSFESSGAQGTAGPIQAAAPTMLAPEAQWRLSMLTDSCLPTGGFAHSAGLEAVAQLALRSRNDGGAAVVRAVAAAARSNARLHAPFVSAAHALVCVAAGVDSAEDAEPLERAWRVLDRELGALLAGCPAATRASLSQGAALARVGAAWARAPGQADALHAPGARAAAALLARLSDGHAATVVGVLAAALGLPRDAAVHAFAYTGARDAISAAIRLDLIGPLQSVAVLQQLAAAAAEGVVAAEAAAAARGSSRDLHVPAGSLGTGALPSDEQLCEAVRHAAGAAPAVDTLHACHELLEMRLFQT